MHLNVYFTVRWLSHKSPINLQGRGHSAPCGVGMAFQQSPCRREGNVTKSHRCRQRCQAKLWCHFPGTWRFVHTGLMAFCPLKSPRQLEHRGQYGENSAPVPLHVPGLHGDFAKRFSHLQQSSYVSPFVAENVVLLRLLYLFYKLF